MNALETANETINIVAQTLKEQGFIVEYSGGWLIDVCLSNRGLDATEIWTALEYTIDRDQIFPNPYRDGGLSINLKPKTR